MKHVKYNFLAATQVFFSLVFFFQLASTFGASQESDAFLIAFSMLSATHLLQLMVLEQFLYFYQQKKSESSQGSIAFYQSALLFAVIVGCIFYTIFNILETQFIEIFNIFSSQGNSVINDIKEVFSVLIIGLIIYPISYVNDRVLNAERRFSFPYISETMPFIFMVLGFVVYNYQPIGITITKVAEFKNYGMLIGLVFTTTILWRAGFLSSWKLSFDDDFRSFVKNSFLMRFSHNINNFCIAIIVNAFLITLAPGLASIYHYALRGVIIVKQVIVGPFYRIFQSELSSALYSNRFDIIEQLVKNFFRKSVVAYILFIFVGWLLIEPALYIMSPKNLPISVFKEISSMFILVSFWHLFMVAELSKTTLYMAAKDYVVFLTMNVGVVSVLFFAVLYNTHLRLEEFILINALLQLISFIFYSAIYRKKTAEYESRNIN